MQDLSDGTEGQKGYVIGRIVFEVGSMVFPAAKAGLLAKLGKVEVFNHLMTKGRLIGTKARQAMTALRTPLQVTRMCFVAGTLVKAKQGLMKIEDVQPGMEVWSRDEFTQQEGWKPVAQTFLTHPAELHHLTYEVRGPPAEGEPLQCETLGVTAPHPFWVSSRSKPGFVPAGELRAGDELRLANGGHAVVTANTRETAPLGETFTTYNFEVADFHTYFAGRSEVWVHNDGVKMCQLARAGIEAMFQKTANAWDAFRFTLGGFTHADLTPHTRLKIFNETRSKYLSGIFSGGTPPWDVSLRNVQTIGAQASSQTLGRNLKSVGIDAPWKDGNTLVQAHHIVPGGDRRFQSAIDARNLLDDAGIDINEASNGCFLPAKAEFSDLGAAIHNGSPPDPKRYCDWVFSQLEPLAGNPAALRMQLQKMANHLIEVGWP